MNTRENDVVNQLDRYSSSVADFFALLKPRVMTLVVFTGWVGMYLAPGTMHPFFAVIAILAIALGSGAAGAFNMWYERHSDALMVRTQLRPLPAGKMVSSVALEFSIVSALSALLLLFMASNVYAAGLLLFAMFFYGYIYTIFLKRRTPQNIVIGGAAGALPPMIGWVAVTGTLDWYPFLLFLLIFFWTPPHFWALSLYRSEEYSRAGIPMLPVLKGNAYTRAHIWGYSLVLWVVSILPYLFQFAGSAYALVAALLGAEFVRRAFLLWRVYEERAAKKLFAFSIVYLFLIFLALVVDHFYINL